MQEPPTLPENGIKSKTPQQVRTVEASNEQPWYYNIELLPEVFSKGAPRPTLALARVLFRDVPMRDLRCLDVGTMEGVIPTLMARAGAAKVVATDWVERSSRVDKVKEAHQVDFSYHKVERLDRLGTVLGELFDIVNFSGVMYHMINPLGGLAAVRSMCRAGGLMLVETAVVHGEERLMYFDPRRLGDTRYFYPTTKFFESMLRLIRLQPIAIAFMGEPADKGDLRLAVLCTSEADPQPCDEEDRWFGGMRVEQDFRTEAGLDFRKLRTDQPPLAIPQFCSGGILLEGKGIYEVVSQSKPYKVTPDEMILRLGANF